MIVFGESSAGVARSRAARILGFTLVGVLWSNSGLALDYDYIAPEACPSREAFLTEVQSRLRYPAEQSTVERLQVTVRRGQGFEASFVLIEPGQPPVSRALTAEVCQDAVQALALGAALALDARYREVRGIPEDNPGPAPAQPPPGAVPPEAQAAVPPTAAAAGVAATVQPVPVQPVPVQPVPVQPVPVQPVPVQPPPVQPSPTPLPAVGAPRAVGMDAPSDAPTETAESEAFTFAARLGALAATGYAPDPSFGPSLAVVARAQHFAFELEGFFGAETRAGNGEQSAEFWVIGARLAPCVRWPLPERFWIKGCGVVELSGVHAEGVEGAGVARTAEELAPYWALGAVAGVEAPLTQALNLGLDLGVQLPLTRRRFQFINVDEPLHEYPSVAARAQLTICYAF